jgi:hypothetical protein
MNIRKGDKVKFKRSNGNFQIAEVIDELTDGDRFFLVEWVEADKKSLRKFIKEKDIYKLHSKYHINLIYLPTFIIIVFMIIEIYSNYMISVCETTGRFFTETNCKKINTIYKVFAYYFI